MAMVNTFHSMRVPVCHWLAPALPKKLTGVCDIQDAPAAFMYKKALNQFSLTTNASVPEADRAVESARHELVVGGRIC